FSCNNIVAAPSTSVLAGNNITLSVNCSGGTAPYNYTWSGGGSGGCPASGGSSSQQVLNAAAAGPSSAYSVSVTDSAAVVANKGPINVAWNAGGGGGGGGGGAISCLGSPTDTVGTTITGPTLTIDVQWPPDFTQLSIFTSQYGSFPPNGAVV